MSYLEYRSLQIEPDKDGDVTIDMVNQVVDQHLNEGWDLVSVVAWPQSVRSLEAVWVFFTRKSEDEQPIDSVSMGDHKWWRKK